MRPGGSKGKGNAFERLVAVTIRKDLEPFGIGPKDIFRTPNSGGHPFCDDCDLIVSAKLFKIFPFVIECKHEKKLSVGGLFDLRRDFQKHLKQVTRAVTTSKANGLKGCSPLLVWQGNFTNIYAAGHPSAIIAAYGRESPEAMHRLHFTFEGQKWVMLGFNDFRKLIIEKAEVTL
jgi:hypothetical protein